MKQESKRYPVDTIYILGAGASYALSESASISSHKTSPLDKDFMSKLINKFESFKQWQGESIGFIKRHWIGLKSIQSLGLEAAIIERVSKYDFLSHMHPRKISIKRSNEEYLNHLSHLIAAYLFNCKENNKNFAARLIDLIFPVEVPVDQYKNRIVTFNYDSIIDDQMLKRRLAIGQIFFDKLSNRRTDKVRRAKGERFEYPLILKLHGSVSWRVSRDYFDKIINGLIIKDEAIPIWYDNSGPPKPIDDVSPLIIPPIPNKPITQSSIFCFLWQRAYEYLLEAENIVIIGYSCPETDTMAMSMFNQFRGEKLRKITIVDPDASILSKYQRIISPSGNNLRWEYFASIQDFLDAS